MQHTLVWQGIGEFRAEIARAEFDGDRLLGRGTQIGFVTRYPEIAERLA
jgi:hypothetical protein